MTLQMPPRLNLPPIGGFPIRNGNDADASSSSSSSEEELDRGRAVAREQLKTGKYSKGELIRIYDPICSDILDWMFLGSRCPAMSRDMLQSNGITHILNCAGNFV